VVPLAPYALFRVGRGGSLGRARLRLCTLESTNAMRNRDQVRSDRGKEVVLQIHRGNVMIKILSQEAAGRVWSAHREIMVGQKLLADIADAMKDGRDPNPIDWQGNHRPFTLGVPRDESSTRIIGLSPRLAKAIIEAHIADKQKELQEASLAAKIELETP
jgi:hypothetical protein